MTFISNHQKDKGYAWIVCLASFFIYVICDGVGMAFGVLVPSIKRDLETNSAAAALIGSLHIGTSYMSAPVNTTLAKMIGYRIMSVFGAAIVTTSLVVCGFAKTPMVLTLMYGVTAGVGICMIITTAEICVNQNFDQKRALANGMVFSGSSIGYFLSAPALTYILDIYGLGSAFLAEAALTSCCLFLGLLLKDTDEGAPSDQITLTNHSKSKVSPSKKLKEFFLTMVDKRVVTNKGFIMFAIGRLFNYLSLMVPILYIPSLALESGRNFTAVQARHEQFYHSF